MPLRLKPVARSLSVRAEFFGLELEDWGLVIAWAILMRLIGDHIHRVFLGFLPVSTILAYGTSAVQAWQTARLPACCEMSSGGNDAKRWEISRQSL